MTLGGLALAVGILVDDATVEIENIHRNLAMGKPITQAIIDGAQQIAVPAFVSTLAICIVFVPVVFLDRGRPVSLYADRVGGRLGDARLVFSFPDLGAHDGQYLLHNEVERYTEHSEQGNGDIFWRIHGAFNRRFERMREKYRSCSSGRYAIGLSCSPSSESSSLARSSCAWLQGKIFFRW